jgi:hypothetical protein
MSRWLIVLAVMTGCGPTLSSGGDGDAGLAIDDQLDAGGPALAAAFDTHTLADGVTRLSTGVMSDRSPGSPGDQAAGDYIFNKLTGLGLATTRQAFADATGRITENIVGIRQGLDPTDVIVVGAHHDSLAGQPGANDNASGVISLLAIADSLSTRQLQRTIYFVAFGSEEEPGLADGARHLVADPGFPIDRVVFMLNLDMVGSYDQEAVVYALGSSTSDTGRALIEPLAEASPLLWDLDQPGSDSDYVAFCERGVPYTYIFTSDPECYHDTCDTPDRIDVNDMAQLSSLASDFIAELANAPAALATERKLNGCHDQ